MISKTRRSFRPSVSFIAMAVLIGVLWFAGGASRADVAGQVVVRLAAWTILGVVVLFERPVAIAWRRPPWAFLILAITIAAIQLVPIPIAVWTSLPNRGLLNLDIGTQVHWRMLAIVPAGVINALTSLVVPGVILLLFAGLRENEKGWLPVMVLASIVASMLVGLLQFSGTAFDNPLINETPGVVSGMFANRNHFALSLALGCLFIPIWVFRKGHRTGWRGPVGLGLLILFCLMILATGSRAGIALGGVAILLSFAIARGGLRREFRDAPRWVLPTVMTSAVALLGAFVFVSITANRAVSVQRSLALNVEEDMRSRALPSVWDMTRKAFPVGNGLGSFDPMFRIQEPDALLKPTYFNHAHNDFLEIVLDTGLPGLLMLVAGLIWWGRASVRAWRDAERGSSSLPILGSTILLLIMAASLFDYPARTPMMMALMVIAASWLAERPNTRDSGSFT